MEALDEHQVRRVPLAYPDAWKEYIADAIWQEALRRLGGRAFIDAEGNKRDLVRSKNTMEFLDRFVEIHVEDSGPKDHAIVQVTARMQFTITNTEKSKVYSDEEKLVFYMKYEYSYSIDSKTGEKVYHQSDIEKEDNANLQERLNQCTAASLLYMVSIPEVRHAIADCIQRCVALLQ